MSGRGKASLDASLVCREVLMRFPPDDPLALTALRLQGLLGVRERDESEKTELQKEVMGMLSELRARLEGKHFAEIVGKCTKRVVGDLRSEASGSVSGVTPGSPLGEPAVVRTGPVPVPAAQVVSSNAVHPLANFLLSQHQAAHQKRGRAPAAGSGAALVGLVRHASQGMKISPFAVKLALGGVERWVERISESAGKFASVRGGDEVFNQQLDTNMDEWLLAMEDGAGLFAARISGDVSRGSLKSEELRGWAQEEAESFMRTNRLLRKIVVKDVISVMRASTLGGRPAGRTGGEKQLLFPEYFCSKFSALAAHTAALPDIRSRLPF